MSPFLMVRFGYYVGLAARLLGDHSYSDKYRGHTDDVTAEIYEQVTSEIHARLLAAGVVDPEADEIEIKMRLSQ